MHKISPTNSRHPLPFRPCGLVLVCNWVIIWVVSSPNYIAWAFPKIMAHDWNGNWNIENSLGETDINLPGDTTFWWLNGDSNRQL